MGGGQATDAAALYPDLVRQVVNIDGFGRDSRTSSIGVAQARSGRGGPIRASTT
jgi:pimeloyl-ACP methyl ester carboxylesterase